MNKIPFLLVVDHADSSFQKSVFASDSGFGEVSWRVDASLIVANDVVLSCPRGSDQVTFIRLIYTGIDGALI